MARRAITLSMDDEAIGRLAALMERYDFNRSELVERLVDFFYRVDAVTQECTDFLRGKDELKTQSEMLQYLLRVSPIYAQAQSGLRPNMRPASEYDWLLALGPEEAPSEGKKRGAKK